MKLIYFTVIIIFMSITITYAQTPTKRSMDFTIGDAICSTNGKLSGGDFYACDEKSAEKFVGIFSGAPVEAKTRRDEVFVSKGIIEVNISEAVNKGDYLTTGANGKIKKATIDAYTIGIAIEKSESGKVKVALDPKYTILK